MNAGGIFFVLLLALRRVVLVGCQAGATVSTHHAIIFDAGSSGSRVHVYTWRTGGAAGDFELVEDDLRKVKPGLSAFASDPTAAGDSLADLLRHAEEKVPKAMQASTPVFLMATAGLRSQGEQTAAALLRSAGDALERSPFLFRREWAYILPGKEEGMYGWVTVNYLLGTLQGEPGATSAAIDLGGGSVQLVYAAPPGYSRNDEHSGEVLFAGRQYDLYIASHLGFGLDRARERVASDLAQGKSTVAVEHPCVPAGYEQRLSTGGSEMLFIGTGSFPACEGRYRELFAQNVPTECALPPCGALDSAGQPPMPANIFGFSYLFDRTRAIGLFDGDAQVFGVEHTTVASIRRAAASICALTPREAQRRFEACEDASKWANFCGDAVYIAVLLEVGFGLAPDANFTVGNKVAGVELVWTLGAAIARAASLSSREAPMASEEL